MNFYAFLGVVATLLLLIITGYVCRRIGIVTDDTSKKLSRLVIEIGQPALIIHALIRADYDAEHIRMGFVSLGVGIVSLIVFALIAAPAVKPVKGEYEQTLTRFSVVFANCGFIGFPVLESLLGSDGKFMGAFYVASFNLLLWTLGTFILSKGHPEIKLTPMKAFFNFGSIPCAIGLGIYLSRVPVPDFLMTFLDDLAGLCTPISVIVTGALIATRPLKELLTSPRLYYQSLWKLLLLPMLSAWVTIGVCLLFHVPNARLWILFVTVMAGLPSAASVTMLTERYKLPCAGYASQIVGFSSVACVLTLPVTVLLTQFFIELFPALI